MDNTLTIQLFFFASAIPVALEAVKARGLARVGLWSVAAFFAVAGFIWPFLYSKWPALTGTLISLATNPIAWFVLAVALFFIVRPLWTQPETIDALATSGNNSEAVSSGSVESPIRKIETRLTLCQSRIADLFVQLDKSVSTADLNGERIDLVEKSLEKGFISVSEARTNDLHIISLLHQAISARIRGINLIKSISYERSKEPDWKNIKSTMTDFSRELRPFEEHRFDREGIHLPYFTGKPPGYMSVDAEEMHLMDYTSHIGYVEAVSQRLCEIETQLLAQLEVGS